MCLQSNAIVHNNSLPSSECINFMYIVTNLTDEFMQNKYLCAIYKFCVPHLGLMTV